MSGPPPYDDKAAYPPAQGAPSAPYPPQQATVIMKFTCVCLSSVNCIYFYM